jgi:hypothetical protein
MVKKLYPLATGNRLRLGQGGWSRQRPFFKAVVKNFLILQILFLSLFAYVLGSLYQQTSHVKNVWIAFVDYDQGAIGAAIRQAYSSLQGDSFPTLAERSASDFPSPAALWDSVCDTRYWAALYVVPGASRRLEDALAAGGGQAAAQYNASDALAYIWNEARYASIVDSLVPSNLQTLANAARVAYAKGGGAGNVTSVSGPEALSVLADPWRLTNDNIQKTSQGARVVYNTIVIILVLIQEFFYVGIINGMYLSFKIYTRADPLRIIVVRGVNSLAYTFVGSLCTTGAIWAFRADWNVDGRQFVANWMVLWLFAHANFLTLDVFTIWTPAAYVPLCLISWVILNVTSILLPFELSPSFYQIGYIFPAREVYQILVNIWSRGCNPQLHIALPVLFAWEVFGFCLSALGVYRRSHYACLNEKQQGKAFQERLNAALKFEREKEKEALAAAAGRVVRQKHGEIAGAEAEDGGEVEAHTTEEVRRELTKVIEEQDEKRDRMVKKETKGCSFGPAFGLPFGEKDGDSDSSEE